VTLDDLCKRGLPIANREDRVNTCTGEVLPYMEAWAYRGDVYMIRYEDGDPGPAFRVSTEKRFLEQMVETNNWPHWDLAVADEYVEGVLDEPSFDYEYNASDHEQHSNIRNEGPEVSSRERYASGDDALDAPKLRRS